MHAIGDIGRVIAAMVSGKETAMSLKGKYALVTGGSRGIGRGIALRLAESGARVAIHYYVNEAAALLCSSDAAWITGQLVYADGGASLVDTLLPLELQRGE